MCDILDNISPTKSRCTAPLQPVETFKHTNYKHTYTPTKCIKMSLA